METTSGGISSIIQTTKSKLLVLSSLLGVGAIIYFTKNYLQQGQFWSASHETKKSALKHHPTIIGGKRTVVIKDENLPGHTSTKVFRRQRSRRTSTSSSKRKSSVSSILSKDLNSTDKQATDVNLNKAIAELNKTVTDVEEVLGLKNDKNYRNNVVIEAEISRLRKLIDFAQDVQTVTEKTNNYLTKQQLPVEEDFIEVENVQEMNSYDELVETIRNQKVLYDDYDSDNDSFLSATESVDLEISDEENYEDILTFERSLKEVISKHSKHDFYMKGIEYLTHYGVPVRSIRTELLKCDNDVDFCIKVHCIRRAFKNLLKNAEHRAWFLDSGKEVLTKLLTQAKQV